MSNKVVHFTILLPLIIGITAVGTILVPLLVILATDIGKGFELSSLDSEIELTETLTFLLVETRLGFSEKIRLWCFLEHDLHLPLFLQSFNPWLFLKQL